MRQEANILEYVKKTAKGTGKGWSAPAYSFLSK